jgi:hypothetical protein
VDHYEEGVVMKVNSLEDAGIPGGATPVVTLWRIDGVMRSDWFGAYEDALEQELFALGDAREFREIRMGRGV